MTSVAIPTAPAAPSMMTPTIAVPVIGSLFAVAAIQTADYVSAIERLGGWGLVVVIMVWMLKVWERRMSEYSAAMSKQNTTLAEMGVSMAQQATLLQELLREQRSSRPDDRARRDQP